MNQETYRSIVSCFNNEGTVSEVKALGNGLINDTYHVVTSEADCPDYVLQRINDSIFTDVALLQRNIELVTAHLRYQLQQRARPTWSGACCSSLLRKTIKTTRPS